MNDLYEILKMVVEVLVFATGIYVILRFLRRTRGSGVVSGLTLVLLVGGVIGAVLIELLGLQRLQVAFGYLASIAILGLIVIFQPEIRRAIVELGNSPMFARLFRTETNVLTRLVRSIRKLAENRIGALIALEREGSLAGIAASGTAIDSEVNPFLIESIFQPSSALHDGAVVIRNNRIAAAGCLLPVSQNPDLDKRLGTRHRAALGLSEETDALVLVVSEETGKVSAAVGGRLRYDIPLDDLERALGETLHPETSRPGERHK